MANRHMHMYIFFYLVWLNKTDKAKLKCTRIIVRKPRFPFHFPKEQYHRSIMGAWYVWSERRALICVEGIEEEDLSCLRIFLSSSFFFVASRGSKGIYHDGNSCALFTRNFYLIEKRTLLTRTHRIYSRHFSLSRLCTGSKTIAKSETTLLGENAIHFLSACAIELFHPDLQRVYTNNCLKEHSSLSVISTRDLSLHIRPNVSFSWYLLLCIESVNRKACTCAVPAIMCQRLWRSLTKRQHQRTQIQWNIRIGSASIEYSNLAPMAWEAA